MNENTENTMSEAEESAFDSGWDDESAGTYEPETTDENAEEATEGASVTENNDGENQPAAESAEASKDDENGETPKPSEDSFELKYMGETRRVGRNEAVVLAQKGLDYDRIRKERDDMSKELSELRPEKQKLTDYEGFLDKLARSVGMDIPGMIDSTLAKMLVAEEQKKGNTITEEFARQKIQFDREKAEYEKQKNQGAAKAPEQKAPAEQPADTKADDAAAARRNDEAAAFLKAYPDLDPKTLPKEVLDKWWDGGESLITAYTTYENKRLKAENEALRQNNKNSERSTGSVQSAGAGRTKDAFDEGWDSV